MKIIVNTSEDNEDGSSKPPIISHLAKVLIAPEDYSEEVKDA